MRVLDPSYIQMDGKLTRVWGQLGNDHWLVIHADDFVDPITGVHTKGVESYWSQRKQKIKAVYVSCHPLILKYVFSDIKILCNTVH